MVGKKLKELPNYERPDLTSYLIHLTKARDGRTALENLQRILKEGKIRGTTSYVQGSTRAACFMDVPFAALKYICSPKNAGRYEPYGIVVQKKHAYRQGCRPVLYLSSGDQDELQIPPSQIWRVVSFEYDQNEDTWIDWQHEREWRRLGDYDLQRERFIALVRTVKDVQDLQKFLNHKRKVLQCSPLSIIPLAVVCQGLS